MSRGYLRDWTGVLFAAFCLMIGGCGRPPQPALSSIGIKIPPELQPLQGYWQMDGDESDQTFCRLCIEGRTLRMTSSMPEWEGVFRNNAQIRSVEPDGSIRLHGSPHPWQYTLEEQDGREMLDLRFHIEFKQRWIAVKLIRQNEDRS